MNLEITREDGQALLARIRAEPEWFVRNILGTDPWEKQIEIMNALRDNRRVAVRSAHSCGKSHISANIVLWYLFAFRPSVVITTAPTDRQVKTVLWKEIRKLHRKARYPLGGRMLTQEFQLAADWFAFGFTSPDHDPDKFQGHHSEHQLVVVDEAAGVSERIFTEGISAIVTGSAKLLLIGNPTNSDGRFARAFTDSNYAKIKISAFDTPNFTTFGITQEDIESGDWADKITDELPRPYLVDPEWVAEHWNSWGKAISSPLYQARVLADFPTAGEDTLIPLNYILAAQERNLTPSGELILAVDVARFGSDETVVMRRMGQVARVAQVAHGWDTMRTAGMVRNLSMLEAPGKIRIDSIGIGAGVYDRLYELKVDGIEECVFSAGLDTPDDIEKFANLRAKAYWHLRTLFELGEIDIDPTDDELVAQLASLKYQFASNGKIQIWSKDKMRKEGLKSPDRADALAMAMLPEVTREIVVVW